MQLNKLLSIIKNIEKNAKSNLYQQFNKGKLTTNRRTVNSYKNDIENLNKKLSDLKKRLKC